MRKLLQLTLLLSLILMLSSQSINSVSEGNIWTAGHTLEESFNDADIYDLEGTLAKTILFSTLLLLADGLFLLNRNRKENRLTFSSIRAPPIYIV